MELSAVVVYVLVGAVVGFIIGRMSNSNANQADMKTELDKTKSELKQHRQDLVDHFSSSAELLENIYRDYNKLCQMMAKTSTDLLPEQADKENPFAKRLAHTLETSVEKEPIELPEAPRDYSETSSGLLKNESTEPAKTEKEESLVKEEKKEKKEKKENTEKVE